MIREEAPDEGVTIEDALVLSWQLNNADRWFDNTKGWCVNGTRLGIDALAHFLTLAWPVCFDTAWHNETGRRMIQEKIPAELWPVEAHGVACLVDDPLLDGSIGGHMCLATNEWVVDLTATQFERPHKDIHIEGPLQFRSEHLHQHRDWGVTIPNPAGGQVWYRPRNIPASFWMAPGWVRPAERAHVEAIVAGMNEVMDNPTLVINID